MCDGAPQTTTPFLATNSVKQDGISSPMLFNVYMDDLGIKLNQSGIDKVIGGHLINHLCYADDLCSISLSSVDMQKCLDMCSTYATEHLLPITEVNHIPCVLSINILNCMHHVFI